MEQICFNDTFGIIGMGLAAVITGASTLANFLPDPSTKKGVLKFALKAINWAAGNIHVNNKIGE